MCIMTSHMDPKSYSHAVHPARKSPVTFKPPSAPLCGSSSGSPKSPSAMGSMNYSPRHSCKPSSLSSSRNINIQRLSLNVSPPQSPPVVSPPKRGKPLALLIPSVSSPSTYEFVAQTPIRESVFPADIKDSPLPIVPASPHPYGSGHGSPNNTQESVPENKSIKLRSPFKSGSESIKSSHDELEDNLAGLNIHVTDESTFPNVQSTFQENSLASHEEAFQYGDSGVLLAAEPASNPSMPEELQEIGLTSAYPHGPANVLNSVVYLYSDPETSELPVDINDYDLVINVAKECKDLSIDFDNKNGVKKYLRVPWSHTSTISKELPMITREITAMDKPGKRILIHCQCGVSRSACVVVAYFMVKFKISVNQAYELLKSGTDNQAETCSQQIKVEGNHVDACERICPNMNLIFELMDFGDRLEKAAAS